VPGKTAGYCHRNERPGDRPVWNFDSRENRENFTDAFDAAVRMLFFSDSILKFSASKLR
jgi:hypothetical protein